MSANPTALIIHKGPQTNSTMAISTLALTSLDGFTGTISISTLVTHTTQQHAPSATLSSNSLALSSGGSATVILTVAIGKNTTTATYAVQVIFTNGSSTHAIVITVTVAH
jgi:hypothetical protein